MRVVPATASCYRAGRVRPRPHFEGSCGAGLPREGERRCRVQAVGCGSVEADGAHASFGSAFADIEAHVAAGTADYDVSGVSVYNPVYGIDIAALCLR